MLEKHKYKLIVVSYVLSVFTLLVFLIVLLLLGRLDTIFQNGDAVETFALALAVVTILKFVRIVVIVSSVTAFILSCLAVFKIRRIPLAWQVLLFVALCISSGEVYFLLNNYIR